MRGEWNEMEVEMHFRHFHATRDKQYGKIFENKKTNTKENCICITSFSFSSYWCHCFFFCCVLGCCCYAVWNHNPLVKTHCLLSVFRISVIYFFISLLYFTLKCISSSYIFMWYLFERVTKSDKRTKKNLPPIRISLLCMIFVVEIKLGRHWNKIKWFQFFSSLQTLSFFFLNIIVFYELSQPHSMTDIYVLYGCHIHDIRAWHLTFYVHCAIVFKNLWIYVGIVVRFYSLHENIIMKYATWRQKLIKYFNSKPILSFL